MRFGVIGAGLMGRLHAENLGSRVPRAKLVAVADIARDVAEECASANGIDAAYDSDAELFARPDIDAVAVCTPPDSHAELVVAAVEAGKHVFCEKPLADGLDGAYKALVVAKHAGMKIQVGFNRRFDRRFREAREVVRSGNIGEVYTLHIVSRDPVRAPDEIPKFELEMFVDTTIHDLDMLRFLTGREVSTVYAVGHPTPEESTSPHTAITVLSVEGGATATIDNSWLSTEGYDQRLEVFGSKGVITVDNEVPEIERGGIVDSRPFFVRRYFDSYVAEMTAFVESVANDEPPLVTGEDGWVALRLALACRRSWLRRLPEDVSDYA